MRLIDADALRARMYHDAFEVDSDFQKWESGCWIRYKMFENAIDDAPTIEPKRGENLNNKYMDCDQFICSECGIELRDWTRVEVDEDDGEEYHYEYVFRFCPNCGAHMKGADNDI